MSQATTIADALRQAEAAHDRDAQRDPRLGLDDPYRPFDIAIRAIKLLYPGTNDDDIELPAYEYPRVPSAMRMVRAYIEEREAQEARKHPRTAALPAPIARRAVVYGEVNGEMLFVLKARAEELIVIHRAMGEAQTWGDFRRLAPKSAYAELVGLLKAGTPADSRPFDLGDIEPIADGEFPGLVAQEMFAWIPDAIIETFGIVEPSMLAGEVLAFDPDDEEALLEALGAAGFDCERNDDVVRAASGY